MDQPAWITDKLPRLVYTPVRDYSWRSTPVLVILRQNTLGHSLAVLLASEDQKILWWQFLNSDRKMDVETVLGWLPLDVLPASPGPRQQPWQLTEE